MAETLFYHLTRRRLETALPELLERTLARGWRAVVRCGAAERVEDLDRLLWTWREDAFLPHAARGAPRPERQPIYLTDGPETPNAPHALFVVEGADPTPPAPPPAELARVCLLFDGRDEAALAGARAAWKAVVAAQGRAIYWAEDADGRWEKRRDSAAKG